MFGHFMVRYEHIHIGDDVMTAGKTDRKISLFIAKALQELFYYLYMNRHISINSWIGTWLSHIDGWVEDLE